MKKQKNTTEEKVFGFGEVMSMLESMNEKLWDIAEIQREMIKTLDRINAKAKC